MALYEDTLPETQLVLMIKTTNHFFTERGYLSLDSKGF